MATFADALAISIGLDPTAFRKGSAEVTASMRKTREGAVKEGKEIERSIDGASQAVDRLTRNALRLFAVFTAGRAVKDFVADITSADSALGRLAQRIGTAPEAISGLANAVARNGGSAEAAAGSFQRLSDSINELKTTGNSSALPAFAKLQGVSGKQIRLNTDLTTTFLDLADAAKGTADKAGEPMANYLLRQAGVDQDTAALLIQGRTKVMEALRKSGRLGIVSKADTDAARKLQETLETLRQASESLGRAIMTTLTPVIVDLLKPIQEWIEANREWIKTEITARVREFGEYLKSIDWRGIGQGILNFVSGCNEAAKAVGGWGNVVKALFAMWLGKQFLLVLANIGLLRAALTGGKLSGGLISALGLLGTVGIAGILAGSAATDAAVPNAQKPGVITRSDDENTGAADAGGMWGAVKRGWRGVRRMFGGGGAEADEGRGGAGIRTRARRAARGPDGIPYTASSLKEGVGITDAQYNAYREGLTDIEGKSYTQTGGAGGRYSGRYQFGPAEIKETAIKLGETPPTRAQFLADPAMQERFMERYTLDHHNYLMRKSEAYRNLSPEKKLEILGYAHNQGAGRGGALTYLETGRAGRDGFGTSGTAYFDPIRRRLGQIPQQAPAAPKAAPAAPTAAPVPSAWNGIPAAAAAVAQVQAAQSARIASISNDNRRSSTHTDTTNMHGPINVYSSADNANDLIGDLKQSLKGRAYAMASNSGQA